jgi:CCR4-NOT complex subunit CAF16
MSVALPRGATCLLIGPNGAGKTSLLKVLGGKHMVPKGSVSVLGEPPFHATGLTTSGALSYIGGNWERDVAFAGYAVPLAVSWNQSALQGGAWPAAIPNSSSSRAIK